MNLKVVTKEEEKEFTFQELDLPFEATDTEILNAVKRTLDQDLTGYIVTRHGDNILVSPAPVYG